MEMVMPKYLPLILTIIAAGIYLQPLRQQAVYFNECVEDKGWTGGDSISWKVNYCNGG